jgi:hypothetical protein
MHHAPAVSVTVERSAVQGRWLAAALALGLGVGATWLRQSDTPGWSQGWYLLLYLLTAALALRQWYCAPSGRLQWDGQAWYWSAWPLAASDLKVHLDGQNWLLASLQGEAGRTLWLWLERRTDAAAWPALRRAAFAPTRRSAEGVQMTDGRDAAP